jgi:hypothetical protein
MAEMVGHWRLDRRRHRTQTTNMEVLVSRSRRRVSRVLIAVLGVCLAIWGAAALLHSGRAKPAGPSAARVVIPEPNSIRIVPSLQLSAAMSRSNSPATTMPAEGDKYSPDRADTNAPGSWAQLLASQMAAGRSHAQSSGAAASTEPSAARDASADLESTHIRQVALTPPVPTLDSAPAANSDPMSRAKALADAGNLVDARALLNDQLITGKLSDADTAAVKKQIDLWNQALVFSPRPYANDPFAGAVLVKSGDNMSKIASEHDVTWELLSRINGVTPQKMRAGSQLKFIVGPFHAVVSKKAFTIDLYLGAPGGKGSMFVTSYAVGLGKDDSTPPGTWMVEPHKKIKNPTYYSPRGEGVIEAGDPKNPLGPFWIGLSGIDGQAVGQQSYGIHGTIDPTSIGKQSSMGCIRLHNEDVTLVYEMLVEGKSLVLVTQ